MSLPIINVGKINQHSFDIRLTRKNAKDGEILQYGVSQFFTAFSISQALSMKSMFFKGIFSDGLGLYDKGFISMGDELEITLYRNEEDTFKIIKKFYISEFSSSQQTQNTKHRVMTIAALTKPGYLNKNIFISVTGSGKSSDTAKDVLKTYLSVNEADIDAEETSGDVKFVFTKAKPFVVLQNLSDRSISANSSYEDNLFFAFETVSKYNFKSARELVNTARVFKYKQFATSTPSDDEDDYYRILHYTQPAAGSRNNMISQGIIDNEIVSFNFIDRTVASNRFDYETDKDKVSLMGKYSPHDISGLKAQLKETTTTQASIDTSANTKIICDDASYERTEFRNKKEPVAKAQLAMLRENKVTIKVYGNHEIVPGDIIDMEVPAKFLVEEEFKQFDNKMHGRYLVAGVRHDIGVGVIFDTIIDLYKDAFEIPVSGSTNSDSPVQRKEYRYELQSGGAAGFDDFLNTNNITIAKGRG
jgi:hypothetical protein